VSRLRSIALVLLAALPGAARGAIASIGTGGTASNTAAYATSITPGLPTGWAAGHACVLVAHYYANGVAEIQTPSGWTPVASATASTTYGELEVFYRVMQAGDSDPTLTVSPATSDKFSARVWCFSGVDTTTPIDVSGSQTDQAANTTFTGTVISIVTADAMVLFAGGSRDDNTWGTWGGSITTGEYAANSTSTRDNSVFLGWDGTPTGTPTGNITAPTAVQLSLGGDAGRHLTFALRPSSSSPGSATITGVSAIGAAGALSASGASASTLTGVSGIGVAGTFSATGGGGSPGTATITGVSAIGAAGAVSSSGRAASSPTGVASLGATGANSSTGAASATVAGVAGVGVAGTFSASGGGGGTPGTATITGVSGTGIAGAISSAGRGAVTLAGVSGIGVAGAFSASGGGDSAGVATITGVSSRGVAGDIRRDQLEEVAQTVRRLERAVRRLQSFP
jgi:hypothetical protein